MDLCSHMLLFSLLFSDGAALTGSYCCAMDAASKAISFEETARTGLLWMLLLALVMCVFGWVGGGSLVISY